MDNGQGTVWRLERGRAGGYEMHIPAGCCHGGRMAECCRRTLTEAVGLS